MLCMVGVYGYNKLPKHAGLVGTDTKKNPLPSNATNMLAEDTGDYSPEQSDLVLTFFYIYRELVGATPYTALHTRPDVVYAVGVLSRQCKQPSLAACKSMVYLLKYIQGSPDKGIRFSGSSFNLHVFSDTDWAGDLVNRRSTTGDILFACGGPIVWQSKLHATVSTSSMQAKYQAMYAGMHELEWIWGVMGESGRLEDKPTLFFIDSQSAEDLALNPVFQKISKLIEIKYHRNKVRVGPWRSEAGARGVYESGSGPIHRGDV